MNKLALPSLLHAVLVCALFVGCPRAEARDSSTNKYKLILSPGISLQNSMFAELNLMYAQTAVNHTGLGIRGARLGIETNFRSDDYIFAPKLGYEISALFFCLRGSAAGYIDRSKKLDLRLLPEIGLSFFGLANLTYGYGFPILKHESTLGRNRIALTFNLSQDLWKDIFR
ncbi:MAG: hypothetical protein LBC98_06445 [Prevotellaceae bacterium]|jgi:hypothetical protein|nr:hypothetical protein [Prevotellaceae bacterium]